MDFADLEGFCVVGNSGILSNSNSGKVIDNYSHVARINNFQLGNEYRNDVGIKVDVWICSFYTDIKDMGNECSFDKILVPLPLDDSRYESRYLRNSSMIDKYIDKIQFIPISIYEELVKINKNPSTGLCFLFWYYKFFGRIDNLGIYGYSFFNNKNSPHHYFDDYSKCGHNGDLEKEIYKQLLLRKL